MAAIVGMGPGTTMMPRIMGRQRRIRHMVVVSSSLPKDPARNQTAFPRLAQTGSSPAKCQASSKPRFVRKAALDASLAGGSDGSDGGSGGGGGGDGGGSGGEGSGENNFKDFTPGGLLALVAKGWDERVLADSQFPFKVLTEQLIGVTASVIGDMASRPNFGLNELDFVFSTLVVGSIVNFMLMFLLAPATSATETHLPGIFHSCPEGHMFEPGNYTILQRAGTYAFKAIQFGGVGFLAGLVGTAISSTLLVARQTFQPGFKLQNDPPPTLLNAATWGVQLAFSSNLRYQCLNGLDQVLLPIVPPPVFKGIAFVLRGLNNVVGGFSFVMLARVTGSQPKEEKKAKEDTPLALA